MEPHVTVRDALGLEYPIRHQSPTAFTLQHLPDETSPTVSAKGTIYAEREQVAGGLNPHYYGWVRQDSTGNSARSIDGPSATVATSGMLYLYDEDPGKRPQKHEDPSRQRKTALTSTTPQPLGFAQREGGALDLFGEDEVVEVRVAGNDRVIEEKGRRRLTYQECAALQGFPSGHPWQGQSTAKYKQIGNAVPPPLAQALGQAVAALYLSGGEVPSVPEVE
jgi:site-specific DNA-cytosine methylase